MHRMRVFKKFLVPNALLCAAVIGEADGSKVKPSDLPIYSQSGECIVERSSTEEPGALERQIGVVRKELWVWHDKYKGLRKEVIDVCETGLAHTEASLEYLKEESNYLPRYGAIGIGGVAGVVLGLRGGAFRRLMYGTTGALAVAALCYPAQAAQVGQEAAREAKRGVKIAYNFAYGVKPDYLSLPDPANFLPDDGADVKKPAASSSVAKPSVFADIKTSFMQMTGLAEPPPRDSSTVDNATQQ